MRIPLPEGQKGHPTHSTARYGGDTGRYSASRLARPGEAAVEEEIGRAKERHRRVAGAAEEEPHARVAEGPQLGPLRSDHGRHVQRPQIVQRLALRGVKSERGGGRLVAERCRARGGVCVREDEPAGGVAACLNRLVGGGASTGGSSISGAGRR